LRLVDCFSPALSYGAGLRSTLDQDQPALDTVRRAVEALLDRSQRLAEKAGLDEGKYESGRFAVTAWLDELILISNWREKDNWEKQQLQLVRYQTTNAGEEFYQRLDQIMGDADQELLAVYGACLALGFGGRYYPIREKITLEETSREVMAQALAQTPDPFTGDKGIFFPGAYHREGETPKKPTRWGLIPFWFLSIGAAAGVLVGTWISLDHYLNELVELYFKSGM
jgi:type VI secretion system protein ImpK